jgi:hypothetical protein
MDRERGGAARWHNRLHVTMPTANQSPGYESVSGVILLPKRDTANHLPSIASTNLATAGLGGLTESSRLGSATWSPAAKQSHAAEEAARP